VGHPSETNDRRRHLSPLAAIASALRRRSTR
jgi:hypothetical protein